MSKGKKQEAAAPVSHQHELVVCDLSFPRLMQEMRDIEDSEFEEFERSVQKIKKMTWDQVYKTSSKTDKRGLNWEPTNQVTKAGSAIATIRVSQKFRARVCRSKNLMRFISLHPDHDSAYKESGGEDV